MNDPWSYIASLGVQHHSSDDPLFQEGNDLCRPLQKAPCIDLDDEELLDKNSVVIDCVSPGCKSTFSSVADHAAHQHACHSHVCGVCKRNLPSHHLLDLHLLEAHDSLFQLQAQKQPMYQCLLEICSEKFKNAQERKEHCIASHSFPSDFRYDLSCHGNSYGHKRGARSKSEQFHKIKGNEQIEDQKKNHSFNMDYEEYNLDTNYDSNLGEMNMSVPEYSKNSETEDYNESVNIFQKRNDDSTVNTNETSRIKVPKNICFGMGASRGFSRGRGGRGGGTSRSNKGGNPHWHQRHRTASSSGHYNTEEINMADIEQALDEAVAAT